MEDAGDNEAAMTLDEFKQGMFRSLRDSGAMDAIRAQLRRQVIQKLQSHRRAEPATGEEDESDRREDNNAFGDRKGEPASTQDRIESGLVAEFLQCRGLENTLAVFVPEIGGDYNQLDVPAILEMLRLSPERQQQLDAERQTQKQPLLSIVLKELTAKFAVKTADGETQTAIDCFDHRIALDNQLRRVETMYLAECANQKLKPAQSFQQHMLRYQSEYDALCEKRMQEELERFKTTELALARTEERKRYDREIEVLRASLLQEHRKKQSRLAEREREMELDFASKRTGLETSLFDTRQSLMQEMEKLRTQEAEQQTRREADFRKFTAESKRLEAWSENLRTQEQNVEGLIAHRIREKERAWAIERQNSEQELQFKLDELKIREDALSKEAEALKAAAVRATDFQSQHARITDELQKWQTECQVLRKAIDASEKQRRLVEEELRAKQSEISTYSVEVASLTNANARIAAEKSSSEGASSRQQQMIDKLEAELTRSETEVKRLQEQMLTMKLAEANEVVTERRKLLKVLDEERERFYWKESELLTKVRELQTRLAESEASAEKFQSQYEDERVHVESLRHDVASLNTLLAQAHATINAKHGVPVGRDPLSSRSSRVPELGSAMQSSSDGGSMDRAFMMRMMEFISTMQGSTSSNSLRPVQSIPAAANELGIPVQRADTPVGVIAGSVHELTSRDPRAAKEEEALKEDQQRRERELLEQRAYEKRKQERMEAEEQELAARRKQFENDMARMRQVKLEEEERAEATRKTRLAEDEAHAQRQLELQQKALLAAQEQQSMLDKQRAADEAIREQRERDYQERQRLEAARQAEELEIRMRKQRLDDEEADRARADRMKLELDELQKRREQLDALEEERKQADRVMDEARKQREAEDQARQQDELEARKGVSQAMASNSSVVEAEVMTARQDGIRTSQLSASGGTIPAAGSDESPLEEDKAPPIVNPSQPDQVVDESTKNVITEHKPEPTSEDIQFAGLNESVDKQELLPTSTLEDNARDSTSIFNNFDVSPPPVEVPAAEQHENLPQSDETIKDGAMDTSDNDDRKNEPVDSGVETAETVETKTAEELEEEKRKQEEEQKQKQDESVIDVYRQRVLARKAAEKQRQQELEAEAERKRKEEEEAVRAMSQRVQDPESGSDNELELSGGSFAESSAASNSEDSF